MSIRVIASIYPIGVVDTNIGILILQASNGIKYRRIYCFRQPETSRIPLVEPLVINYQGINEINYQSINGIKNQRNHASKVSLESSIKVITYQKYLWNQVIKLSKVSMESSYQRNQVIKSMKVSTVSKVSKVSKVSTVSKVSKYQKYLEYRKYQSTQYISECIKDEWMTSSWESP
jgi:hypothetical protein